MIDNSFGFDTLAIRSGHRRTAELEHSEAIFATSSFVFENAAQAAARFAGDEPGNIYSRFTNPTTQAFEARLAAMEGGQACVATASGMAAIMSLCVAMLQAGDHIVSSRSIFGTTTTLFDKYLPRMAGIFQAHVFPGISTIKRLVNAIAVAHAALGIIFARTYPNDAGVGRVKCHNTSRERPFLVEDRFPGNAIVSRFPYAAAGHGHIELL